MKQKITKLMILISSLLGVEFKKELTAVWVIALQDLTNSEISDGFERFAKNYKSHFMPTPGEFREFCRFETTPEIKARSAYQLVMMNLNRYRSPYFKDSTISQTIKELGGWVRLCNRTIESLTFVEKDFIRIYVDLSKPNITYDNLIQNGNEKVKFIGDYSQEDKAIIYEQITNPVRIQLDMPEQNKNQSEAETKARANIREKLGLTI